jgi:hypothetical protein
MRLAGVNGQTQMVSIPSGQYVWIAGLDEHTADAKHTFHTDFLSSVE